MSLPTVPGFRLSRSASAHLPPHNPQPYHEPRVPLSPSLRLVKPRSATGIPMSQHIPRRSITADAFSGKEPEVRRALEALSQCYWSSVAALSIASDSLLLPRTAVPRVSVRPTRRQEREVAYPQAVDTFYDVDRAQATVVRPRSLSPVHIHRSLGRPEWPAQATPETAAGGLHGLDYWDGRGPYTEALAPSKGRRSVDMARMTGRL